MPETDAYRQIGDADTLARLKCKQCAATSIDVPDDRYPLARNNTAVDAVVRPDRGRRRRTPSRTHGQHNFQLESVQRCDAVVELFYGNERLDRVDAKFRKCQYWTAAPCLHCTSNATTPPPPAGNTPVAAGSRRVKWEFMLERA